MKKETRGRKKIKHGKLVTYYLSRDIHLKVKEKLKGKNKSLMINRFFEIYFDSLSRKTEDCFNYEILVERKCKFTVHEDEEEFYEEREKKIKEKNKKLFL
jgi:hypothetical protein